MTNSYNSTTKITWISNGQRSSDTPEEICKAYERMLIITNRHRNANQTKTKYHLTSIWMTTSKISQNTKCWGCGEIEMYYGWDCKAVQRSLLSILSIFVYLTASGLSCSTQDTQDLHWGADSLAGMHGLNCLIARGILVPDKGLDLHPPALQGRFLITGPPEGPLLSTETVLRFLKKM